MKNKLMKSVQKSISSFMRDAGLDADESFCLEMNSAGELSVKGCRDVNSFNNTGMAIITDDYFIDVKGNTLQIKEFSFNQTTVSGRISEISFFKR